MIDVNLALGLTRQHPGIELHRTIVANDVEFGPDGRVFILTGPNQGGKTTYTRAIGVAHILCQAGLFVPGSRAVLSPVDGLYTHFSEEEKPNIDNGRLGEESRRLHGIFMNATRHSLILLNESLSSTSSRDSLYVARDIVKAMKVLGCRAVYATHLLELAAGVDPINAELPGDDLVISMVAGVERERDEESRPGQKARRTYKIKPGPPNEMSFAKDIARLYGISFDQIVQTLRERNVIDR
jgi:DNA mismatch repair ATPase MutS